MTENTIMQSAPVLVAIDIAKMRHKVFIAAPVPTQNTLLESGVFFVREVGCRDALLEYC